MALDQTRVNDILSYLHGGGAPPTIAASRLRVYTSLGSAISEGTQVVTGGGYTGGNTASSGTALSWAAASNGSQATSAVAQFVNWPRTETVTAVEIWSGEASPKRIEFGALTTSRAMAAGDTLSFAAGAITSAIA